MNDNNLSFDFVAMELSRGERWRAGRTTWTRNKLELNLRISAVNLISHLPHAIINKHDAHDMV